MRECVRGEKKNLFSLFFFLARVKVTLFSPRGASLCGLNQSKFPLCFLLRGDTLLLSAGPLVRRSSAGLPANLPDNAQVVSQSIRPPLPQRSPQFTWHNYHFLALLLPCRRPANANIWDRRKGPSEARAGSGAPAARCCRAARLPSEGASAWLGGAASVMCQHFQGA